MSTCTGHEDSPKGLMSSNGANLYFMGVPVTRTEPNTYGTFRTKTPVERTSLKSVHPQVQNLQQDTLQLFRSGPSARGGPKRC